ncbi:carbohydrate ABC transporter permease [Eisenbergiella sp.]
MKKRRVKQGLCYIVPYFSGFLLFYLIPVVWCIIYSFSSGVGGQIFVGIENYKVVFGSQAYRLAVYNTLRFLLLGVPAVVVLSFFLAVMLQGMGRRNTLYRLIFLYPMVLPAAGIVFFIKDFFGKSGFFSNMLSLIGNAPEDWLNSEYAFFILVGLYIWKNCGYGMIIFLVGLNGIPVEIKDIAKIEGANAVQNFRYVTFPQLVPNFFFVVIIAIVNSFKCFKEAYLIGGKNPNSSIYMLQHFMNNNFQSLNYQRLSVASILLFIFIWLLVFLLFQKKKRWEETYR